MADKGPATVTRPVRALGAAVHDLTTERHEPDELRGSRPDLWGTAGAIPAVYPAVNPYFVVGHAERFIDFLIAVFDGVEQNEREVRADGGIDHADVMIGDSIIMISEASHEYPARPSIAFAYVDDVDVTYARALTVGSRFILAPTDQRWGDRVGGVLDPFDNRWWIGTHVHDVS